MKVNDEIMNNVKAQYAVYLAGEGLNEKDFSVEDFMDEMLRYYKCEFYQEWYTDKHDMSYVIKEKYDQWVAQDNEDEWLEEYGSSADQTAWC